MAQSSSDKTGSVSTESSQLENHYKIVGLFIDNAKTYTQLSSAALVLSIAFLREVVGIEKDKPMPLDKLLVLSWICFLIAVGAGVYYQYIAVKFLEYKSGLGKNRFSWPKWLIKNPWLLYLIMMLSFYGGAVAFTIGAIKRLP